MYDYERYARKLSELSGDPAALEAFLLGELSIIDEPMASGGSCPCGKSQQERDQEVVSWVQERLTNQIVLRNDLAGVYRAAKDWAKCEAVFADMMKNIFEAELGDSPLHGRILLNRALLEQELERLDAALADTEHAKACFETAPEVAPDALRQAIETIDACKAAAGR